jgi:acyl carrier protein
MNQQILEVIAKIFRQHFMMNPSKITYKHSFNKDFSLNELELNEVLYYVETALQIEMKEDARAIKTVGDLVHCVENYRYK